MNQQVVIVHKGDAAALLEYLREQGVGEDDLQQLADAVSSEPEALTDGNYGPKVGAWLGNMPAKAATGVWEVGLETASQVLPEALNRFYGICPLWRTWWRPEHQQRQVHRSLAADCHREWAALVCTA